MRSRASPTHKRLPHLLLDKPWSYHEVLEHREGLWVSLLSWLQDNRQCTHSSYALTILGSIMEKLQSILEAHVASGEDTKDKLLGAAFVVVNKEGE